MCLWRRCHIIHEIIFNMKNDHCCENILIQVLKLFTSSLPITADLVPFVGVGGEEASLGMNTNYHFGEIEARVVHSIPNTKLHLAPGKEPLQPADLPSLRFMVCESHDAIADKHDVSFAFLLPVTILPPQQLEQLH